MGHAERVFPLPGAAEAGDEVGRGSGTLLLGGFGAVERGVHTELLQAQGQVQAGYPRADNPDVHDRPDPLIDADVAATAPGLVMASWCWVLSRNGPAPAVWLDDSAVTTMPARRRR